MDTQFLDRVVRVSAVLSVALGALAVACFGVGIGVAFGVSALWSTIGLKLMQLLLMAATRPAASRPAVGGDTESGATQSSGGSGSTFGYWVLKFPLHYGVGAVLLIVFRPNGLAVFTGLILPLTVIVLKQLGRALMDSSWPAFPAAGESRKR